MEHNHCYTVGAILMVACALSLNATASPSGSIRDTAQLLALANFVLGVVFFICGLVCGIKRYIRSAIEKK